MMIMGNYATAEVYGDPNVSYKISWPMRKVKAKPAKPAQPEKVERQKTITVKRIIDKGTDYCFPCSLAAMNDPQHSDDFEFTTTLNQAGYNQEYISNYMDLLLNPGAGVPLFLMTDEPFTFGMAKEFEVKTVTSRQVQKNSR